mgnify:CR=1 FL=1
MGQYCTTERDGHLLIVTINRPERMNALHPPANAELAQVFDDFAADPDLWVAIITRTDMGDTSRIIAAQRSPRPSAGQR